MFKKKKLNNNGSTLVMMIVAMAFVALLVAAILAASYANINLKRTSNRSKTTFYTSESVLDELRAGIGHDGLDSLGVAYEEVLTSLVVQGESYKYTINNDEANKNLKIKFIEKALATLTGGQISFGSDDYVTNTNKTILAGVAAKLDGYLKGYDGTTKTAKVKSIGKLTAIKTSGVLKYTIILKDVVVDYKEDKADENFFSSITVDLDITYPNLEIDFTGGNSMQNFIEYSLVTDDSIIVKGTTLNVNAAHIYAGDHIGIAGKETKTGGGGFVNVTGNVTSTDGTVNNANIVTRGDIVIKGDRYFKSGLTVNGGDIWCNNLTIDSYIPEGSKVDISKGAEVKIDSFSKTNLRDDLNVYGQDSQVEVGGSLLAYSYDGSGVNSHAQSSAIIINGDGSLLKFNLNKLIVGGRSYIIIPTSGADNDSYMTGESLSVKADQELYLVPSKCIFKNYSNPMSAASWENLKLEQEDAGTNPDHTPLINITDNIVKDLLDTTTPYVVKKSKNVVYVYYNFKTKENATAYVKRILAGNDAALKKSIQSYFNTVFSGSSSGVSITAGKMYTAGALIQTTGSSVVDAGSATTGAVGNVSYADGGGVIPTDVFTLTALDLKNRNEVITHLLVDFPETKKGKDYIVNDSAAALKEFYSNYDPASADLTSNSTASNIVDYTLIDSSEYNRTGNLVQYGSGIIKLAIDEASYTVPSNVKGGIIITTGSINLDHNFKGLIICKGNINITNDATVTTDITMIEALIKNEYFFEDGALEGEDRQVEDEPFRNYFKAYKMAASDESSSEPVKIENISYKDLVGTSNWRKYDDGK